MSPTNTTSLSAVSREGVLPLEAILCTEELKRRPSRPPDYETENRALGALAQALADAPGTILQKLADTILEVSQADSAGLSLVTTDGTRLYWPAIAGAWKPHAGGGTPRDFGPCGDVLDRNSPLLFQRFERRYTYLLPATPAAEEALLIPFYVHGKAVGTIWVMAHDDRRRFDAEDLRQLESLGRFAAAAYQAVGSQQAQDSRRAALNLMEDAVQARQLAESLNRELRAEITERKQAEALLHHQKEALEMAAGPGSLLEVLTLLIRAVETQSQDGMMGAVHLLNPGGTHFASSAAPSLPPVYIQATEGLELASRSGPCCEAVLRGESVSVPDVARDLRYPRFAELAVQCGIRAGWSTPVLSAQGRVLGSLAVYYRVPREPGARDRQMMAFITRTVALAIEQKQGAEALRISEQRYRTLVDQVQDYAIFSVDLRGRATSWNQGVKRILGFDEAEFLGNDIGDAIFMPEDVAAGVADAELETAAEKGVASNTRWMRRRGGERFFAEGVTTVRKDEQGKVIGFGKVMRDITERKQAEEATAHLAAIVTSSEDAMISKNLDGVITSWNYGAQRLFGYTAEEAVGRPVTMLVPPDRLAEEPKILERLRRGERVEHFETVRVAKDGSRLDISLTISPLKDATGRTVGASKVARDITERKRAEESLARSHAELRASEERLREADRRKDEFLAMLGHELRNPLGAIGSAVRLLTEAAKHDAAATRAHAVIDRQVRHLTRLVDDLLDVGRVTAGKVVLIRRPLDLSQAAVGVVNAWRASGRLDRHQISTQTAPVWVEADEMRLEQIITNLLGNALKYTPVDGSVTVHVGNDGRDAVFQIDDTGVGMAPELVGRVFDLFTQGPQSPDRGDSGLGIGLTLVRHLVELHGGTVTAGSAGLGRGSVFTVRLPRVEQPSKRAVAASEPQKVASRRILLIEDNDDAREMLQFMLEREGHVVLTAADGQNGIALAASTAPDIALVDIGLPGLDGYEVARRIRAAAGAARLTLVALTGYGAGDDRARAEEAGFDVYLVKPVDPERLALVIAGSRVALGFS